MKIDKEFAELCPPLTAEECKTLEANLIEDGCREPIITWAGHQDTIIDGHNRYKICEKHGIKYHTKALSFSSREEVKTWIIRNQLGRRNITISQRAILAAMLSERLVGRPKKNCSNCDNFPSEVGDKTAVEVAEQYGISRDSVMRGKKILQSGNKNLIKEVKAGKKTVSKAVKELECANDPFSDVKEEEILDAEKKPVPKSLREIFALRPRFVALQKKIAQCRTEWIELSQSKANFYCENSVKTDLSNAHHAVKFAAPCVPCNCHGSCPRCKGARYLNAAVYKIKDGVHE